jgi:small conductance mechanosensitive channel
MEGSVNGAVNSAGSFGVSIMLAVVILVAGVWLAKLVRKILRGVLERKDMEPTVVSFAVNLAYYALVAFAALAALAKLGIQTTSFIAVIGAAGLAVGLALQGSLANFAAGFLIVLFRPFRAGDYIEAAGTTGTVESISIFTTQLRTPDNKSIIIPNGKLTADNITNYSAKEERRVDLVFGIGYGDDIDVAKGVIAAVLKEDGRVLDDPPPAIRVLELGESSVNLAVRPWVKTVDYWDVLFDVTEKVKKRFDAEGISIPFPQRDVHLFEHKT